MSEETRTDKPSDVELGKAVGATTILVRTGYGVGNEAARNCTPDFVADDLMEVAALIGQVLGTPARSPEM